MMQHMQEEDKASLQHVADTMKLYYNRNHCATPKYQLGDRVWLNMHNYTTDRPTKKLDHKWAGPYQIKKIVSPAAVKLKLSGREKGVHPVISISNICPYTPDEITECPSPSKPGPLIIDGHEEFKVENVLDSQFRYGRLCYLLNIAAWLNSVNM